MKDIVEFQLSVWDGQTSAEEQQAMLVAVATELAELSAEAVPVAVTAASDWLEKGEAKGGILDVKIDLAALERFGKWLHERLSGTTTKVKIEYEGAKFEFEGRNDRDRAAAQQAFEEFVTRLAAMKRAGHD